MKNEEKLLKLLKENNGIIETASLREKNINKMVLTRLQQKGILERVARGLYINADNFEDNYFIFQYRCPKAIFSHETALYFHDLTDRVPNKLMVTIPSGYYTKLLKDNNYQFNYIKKDLYDLGVTKIKTPYENEVYCYDLERTICDIVRNRVKIEDYQFVDAMKRYAKAKEKNIVKLYKYAEKFNIKEQIQKYMEVLT